MGDTMKQPAARAELPGAERAVGIGFDAVIRKHREPEPELW
jgi:hypothetical protein